MIKYLRVCLAHSAGVTSPREGLELPNESTPKVGRYLRQLHGSKPNILDAYLNLVHQLLVANPGKLALFTSKKNDIFSSKKMQSEIAAT